MFGCEKIEDIIICTDDDIEAENSFIEWLVDKTGATFRFDEDSLRLECTEKGAVEVLNATFSEDEAEETFRSWLVTLCDAGWEWLLEEDPANEIDEMPLDMCF